jgi:hypothetical protein
LITSPDHPTDGIAQAVLQKDLSDSAHRRIHGAQIDLIKAPDQARDAFPAERYPGIEMQ